MAVESRAQAVWRGDLFAGGGSVKPASGAFPELPLTWRQRAESRDQGTSPEELIAAAHAGCFSMALANALAQGGHPPERLETTARVAFQAGEGITGITLEVVATVAGIDEAAFQTAAEAARTGCPVSKALAAVPISLQAALSA